ncbi:MAG TPA: PD-(D/E)XK nuclease family protein [Longimicrobiaceae bacterium]|nr:PD-(D/E)XK nuclease family protein [Longimicrobiaceae bacterium]
MTQTGLLRPVRRHAPEVERAFLGWSRDALRAAASRLADHYADGHELRMDAATVALPGARAGRRLREMLLDESISRKLRLVPPRIVTVGSVPELLYTPVHPPAPDAHCTAAWSRALRRLPAGRLARLFSLAPAEDDVRGWTRLARTVTTLHREVSGAGLRFADVQARCGEGLLFADTERWSVLSEAQALFEAELEALGLSDRGLARCDALAAGVLVLDRDLWLVGVVEMPPVLHRMLASLPAADGLLRVLVHAPESEAGGFDALGQLRPEAWTARPLPLRDDQIAVRTRPAEQAEEVARTLAFLGGRYGADEIVIAAPNEELIPCLERRLADAGVTVRRATGAAAERSPTARLLAAFADYLDGGRADACAALARHPDLGRWLRRAVPEELGREDGWLEALDTYRAEALPTHLDGAVVRTRSRVGRRVGALHDALNDARLLGRMRGRRALTEWMPEIMALLAEVYGEPALDRTRPSVRRLLDACACLRDAAAGLSSLPPELDEECDGPTALRLLLDEVAGAALAPDPDAGAVEVLGWLEVRLDDAPVAVVTGFNEPYLPESVNAHPFLPNALRERLGLTDNARRFARDLYELTALLRSREVVRVVAGRRSATGDPLRPSRLLFQVEGRALAERVRDFFEAGAPSPPAQPPESTDPSAGGFQMPAERVLHAPEPIRKLPVTAFRHLLADPYTFALEFILGLAPLDDRPRELDGLRFGDLAHAVLERFGRSDEVHRADEARVRRRLDELLDDEARERFGARPLPAVRIQLEQLRARLGPFARWHAGWVGEGWRVVGVECRTPEEGAGFEVDGEPVQLTGRIDRIDYHPERRAWALFDYKTGDRARHPEETHRAGKPDGRYWTDLQLPLYHHLLPAVRDDEGRRPYAEGEHGGSVALAYIALPRDLDGVGPLTAGWSDEELRDADECARDVVRLLRENAFTFDPERARAARDTPLAALLGLGSLESAAAAEDAR